MSITKAARVPTWDPAKDKRGVRERFVNLFFQTAKNGRLQIQEFRSTMINRHIHAFLILCVTFHPFSTGMMTDDEVQNPQKIGHCQERVATEWGLATAGRAVVALAAAAVCAATGAARSALWHFRDGAENTNQPKNGGIVGYNQPKRLGFTWI